MFAVGFKADAPPSAAIIFMIWAKVAINVMAYFPLLMLLPAITTAEIDTLVLAVNGGSATGGIMPPPQQTTQFDSQTSGSNTLISIPPSRSATINLNSGVGLTTATGTGSTAPLSSIEMGRSITIFCDRIRHLQCTARVGHVVMDYDIVLKILFLAVLASVYLLVTTGW